MIAKQFHFRLIIVTCVVACGCSNYRLPAIDPTGERIFLPSPAATTWAHPRTSSSVRVPHMQPAFVKPAKPPVCIDPALAPPPQPTIGVPVGTAPAAASRQALFDHKNDGRMMLSPGRLIAPVGTDVVLIAGLCAADGYFVSREPIEFIMSQDSVGHLVGISGTSGLHGRSKKHSGTFAEVRTSTNAEVITRGTETVADDLLVRKGQCWVSLTSANEGTTRVSAVATKASRWPARHATATIHWVDAQWQFPGPAVARAGGEQVLSTAVSRSTNGQPIEGWLVRYEIVSGGATFRAANATVVEVATNEAGRADAAVVQTSPAAGTTQVSIQVIRPPVTVSDAPRTVVGQGTTSISWSAPGLAIQATGPASAAAGAMLSYQVHVTNPGDQTVREVVVRDVLPPGMKFLNSTPAAQVFGDRAEWHLGDLAPQSTVVISLNCRAEMDRNVRYMFRATSADGLSAESHVDTQIISPSLKVSMTLDGSDRVPLGGEARFLVEVTNTGTRPIDNVNVIDTFGPGLAQSEGAMSPIQRAIGRLEAGQTERFGITFIVREAGRHTHTLHVTGAGGQAESIEGSVTGVAGAPPVNPGAAAPGAGIAAASVSVELAGPAMLAVGQTAQFVIDVVNDGTVALTQIQVTHHADSALLPLEATDGYQRDSETLGGWVLPRLEPGQRQQLLVNCPAPRSATATTRIEVLTAEGVSDQAEVITMIKGDAAAAPPIPRRTPTRPENASERPASGKLEVTIAQSGEPVRLGTQSTYHITITNGQSDSDQNLVLMIEVPETFKQAGIRGDVKHATFLEDGKTIRMEPVAEARTGDKLQFTLTGVHDKTGSFRVKVRVTSRRMPDGVTAEEQTTVFAE